MRYVPLALLLGACTTTSGVRSNSIGHLKKPTDGDAVYVRDDGGSKLRVDPNTNIRFKRADGSYTPWVRARHLHANDHGVFRMHRMSLDKASRAEVRGLDPKLEEILVEAKPTKCDYYRQNEVLRMRGPEGCVAEWLGRYLDVRARRVHAVSDGWGKRSAQRGEAARRWVATGFAGAGTQGDGWGKRSAQRGEAARRWVATGFAGAGTQGTDEGRWRFGFVFGGWTTPLDGHGLVAAMEDGIDAHVGLAFKDIAGAEVKNFSGSKSLALVVGSAAVIAAIVAIAKDAPDGWSVNAAADVAEVAVRTAIYAAHCSAHCGQRKRALPKGALASWQLESPDAMAARPLFTGVARRRSDLKIIASAEAGYDFAIEPGFSQTAAVTARIRDFIEIGGGGRHLAFRDDVTGRFLAFGRLGGSFFLDDEHRVAGVILGDLGAGSQVWQTKLNLGFRFRITEDLSAGAFLFSPTYTERRYGRQAFGSWAFPSSLEISYAF